MALVDTSLVRIIIQAFPDETTSNPVGEYMAFGKSFLEDADASQSRRHGEYVGELARLNQFIAAHSKYGTRPRFGVSFLVRGLSISCLAGFSASASQLSEKLYWHCVHLGCGANIDFTKTPAYLQD